MTRALQSHRVDPQSGDLRSAVVFLHGYGANGDDLLSLAEPLKPHMPDTVFIAPDAPETCAGSPLGGYQWFPIPWIDGSSPQASADGLHNAATDLDAFLDGLIVDEDLDPDRTILFGFSQGTMMALHAAPRREDPVAGIVGFSGRLLEPELLRDDVQSRPPILLLHGDQDDVVPPQSLPQAVEGLQNADFKDVYAHVMKDTAHSISPDGLEVALAFMREKLGYR